MKRSAPAVLVASLLLLGCSEQAKQPEPLAPSSPPDVTAGQEQDQGALPQNDTESEEAENESELAREKSIIEKPAQEAVAKEAGTGNVAESSGLQSIEAKLPDILGEIAESQIENLGFTDKSEFEKAKLGLLYQEFSLTEEKPTGRFRVQVVGRHVEYRCETDNETVAKVTIDGTSYDSTKGPLFLISTQSERTQVKQLVADVRNFPKEAEAIKDYALGNPEVAAFFKDAKNKKLLEEQ